MGTQHSSVISQRITTQNNVSYVVLLVGCAQSDIDRAFFFRPRGKNIKEEVTLAYLVEVTARLAFYPLPVPFTLAASTK